MNKYSSIKDDLISEYPNYKDALNQAEQQNIKPGFLKWVVLQLDRKEKINEIIGSIKEFERFHQRLDKKDLYQYKSLADLRSAIEQGGQSRKQQKTKKKESLQGEYDIIYQDDEVLVVHPKSMDSSIYFGQGTKWCVAATVSENYFNDYAIEDDLLYFIMVDGKKYAYLMGKLNNFEQKNDPNNLFFDYTIFDEEDNVISELDLSSILLNKFKIIRSKIIEHFNLQNSSYFTETIKKMTFEEFTANNALYYNNFYSYLAEVSNSPEILRAIYDVESASNEENSVTARRLLSLNESTPQDILLKLMDENSIYVASNNSLSEENRILLLKKESDEPVTIGRRTNYEDYSYTYQSYQNYDLYYKMVSCKNLTWPVVEMILNSNVYSEWSEIGKALAKNLYLSEGVCDLLSRHKNFQQYLPDLIKNPCISEDLMNTFANSPNIIILRHLALNPKINEKAIDRLLKVKINNYDIIGNLVFNETVPKNIIDLIYNSAMLDVENKINERKDLLFKLLRNNHLDETQILKIIAVFEKIYNDEETYPLLEVYGAAAGNLNAPIELLTKIMFHSNRVYKELAFRNLLLKVSKDE